MKIVTRRETVQELMNIFNAFSTKKAKIHDYEYNDNVIVSVNGDEVTIEVKDEALMPIIAFLAKVVSVVVVPLCGIYHSLTTLLKPELKKFDKSLNNLLAPNRNSTLNVELVLSKEEKASGTLLAKELNVNYYTSGKVSGKPWEVVSLFGAKKDVKKLMSYLPSNVLHTVKIGEEFPWSRIEVLATRCGLTDVDGIKGGIIVGGPEDKVDWFIETVGNEFDVTEVKDVELKKIDLEG